MTVPGGIARNAGRGRASPGDTLAHPPGPPRTALEDSMDRPDTPGASRRHAPRLVAALLLLVAALPAIARGTPVLDQSNSVLPTGNFVAIRSGTTAAQVVTVGFAGTLTEVRLVVDPRGTPTENLTLEVQGTTGGAPNGVVLAVASVAPFGGVNPSVSFNVSGAALAVTAGQEIAFVLRSNAALGNDYLARAVPANTYGAGQFTDSGGSFASGAGWDAIFRTYIEPATLPGSGTVDQSNTPAPTGNFAAILNGLSATQTFTVGTSGVLTRIEVMVDPRGTPLLDLVLELRATSGGVPTGPVLARSSVPPFAGPNPLVAFDLAPYNLSVTAGSLLAFTLRSFASGGNDYLMRGVPGNTYLAGEMTNSTGGFPVGGPWDAIFTTYIFDPSSSGVGAPPLAGLPGTELRLQPARPNPAALPATVSWHLDRSGATRLTVHDLSGRLVRTLVDEARAAGPQEARWDLNSERGERVPAGVYFYHLEAGGRRATQRIVVVG